MPGHGKARRVTAPGPPCAPSRIPPPPLPWLRDPVVLCRTASAVERLDRVRALQDEGLNLAAIARLLDDDPLTAVATRPFLDVAPEYRTVDDLRGAFGLTEDEPVVERAIAMGLIAVDEAAEDDPRVRVEVRFAPMVRAASTNSNSLMPSTAPRPTLAKIGK